MSTATHAKTKSFRVAVEGATTDGRNIDRNWITQMAKNYNPTVYGARVNLEHYRGIDPAGLFKAYGDVIALEAREESGEFAGKLGLYAQIQPTDDLVALTKKGQKIYTSIEVDPSFADTKQAYLVGLAITDNPASLGTSVLSFAAQNPAASPFAHKKLNANTLFTAADEVTIELDEAEPAAPTVFKRVTDLLAKFRKKEATDDARFADIGQAVEALANHGADTDKTVTKLSTDLAAAVAAAEKDRAAAEQTRTELASLKQELSATPNPAQPARPAATGATGETVTDC
jgi:chaperonin cofactor prefoldin